MKQLMLVCLLAASATAFAQAPFKVEQQPERDRAEVAKREAEEARTRAKLEEARARLDQAAREVAGLSSQLGRNARRDMIWVNNDRHAVLGVQIEDAGDKSGVRVLRVSPGGPAEEAGLRDGDVIVALNGKSVAGSPNAGRAVNEQMRGVKPEQKIKVRVIRAGKNQDFVVVARPMVFNEGFYTTQGGPHVVAGSFSNLSPMGHHYAGFFPGEFGGLELASITPKLGAYFGVTEGVLVVQAPDSEALKLEDGDVLQTIDGRKPEDGAHALRILRSYKSGENLNITVLRQRKPMTLAVTMPERPEFGENIMFQAPVPPIPPTPPMPPVPASPDGAGFGAGALE